MPVLVAMVVLVAAEVTVVVEVARAIGTGPAILLLLVTSAAGPWLVRRAGFGVWRRTRRRLEAGEVPGREALDGLVLLAGGLLVCIPGFLTDAAGLLLLAPPVRFLARRVVLGRLAQRAGRLAGTIVTTTASDRHRLQPGDRPPGAP